MLIKLLTSLADTDQVIKAFLRVDYVEPTPVSTLHIVICFVVAIAIIILLGLLLKHRMR
jgi:hypothetical protein